MTIFLTNGGIAMQLEFESLLKVAKHTGYDIIFDTLRLPVSRIAQQENVLRKYDMGDRLIAVEECTNSLCDSLAHNVQPDAKFIDRVIRLGRDLGELEFAAIAHERGIPVKPVQTLAHEARANTQKPDFELCEYPNIYFEVKTLARVHTAINIEALIKQIDNNQLSMRNQIKSGSKIASSFTVSQPYGTKLYEKGDIRGLIETLSLKTIGNIKSGQFKHGRTFLVVNLLDLPLYTANAEQLRPVFWWQALPVVAPTSGALWLASLGRNGCLYFFPPEFEGKPGIEGAMDFDGLLWNKSEVSGIVWLVHSQNGPARPMATLRKDDVSVYQEEEDGRLWLLLQKLVESNWNDELDSNGWQLPGVV
jgi:hypothetical protein